MQEEARRYFLNKLNLKPDFKDRVVNQNFDKNKIKNIHLTGICGKAMASLAGLLVKAGYKVTGSEASWNPPMSTVLENLGISFKPFSKQNLEGIDLLVMGNAYSPSNIEAEEARLKNIPQISSAEAYAIFFIKDSRSIVVAGTHGKTTTSGLASHIFIESGKKTNALVGGVLSNIGESYYYGGEDAIYSVVEGDEYDTAYFDKAPKFLHYKPTIGIITSIEFDHADIYDDMDDYLSAFIFFAAEIPQDGYLLINEKIKEEYLNKIKKVSQAKIFKYGFSKDCDIRILNNRVDLEKGGQSFDIEIKGQNYRDFFLPMFGSYNIENATSIISISILEGLNEDNIKKSLSGFLGTEQRQQVLFDKNNVVVINDFAHHPTAVKLTIKGVRDHYPNKRIISIFEPRSSTSRRKDFENSYGESFDSSDLVIISKPPIKSVDSIDNMMDVNKVVLKIKDKGINAEVFSDAKEILDYLDKIVKENDVVLIMSNGTFDELAEKFVFKLSNIL